MQYNFDTIIPRNDTNSLKYDYATRRGLPDDVLPLWLPTWTLHPPSCYGRLIEKSQHGIYGYSDNDHQYEDILTQWFSSQYHWTIKPQWLIKTPGVVFAINMAIHAYTKENDSILIQEPVYYPFRDSIENNHRNVVVNELIYTKDHTYIIDFEDFEKKNRATQGQALHLE